MNRLRWALLAAVSVAAFSAAGGDGPTPPAGPAPTTPKEKISYSIGNNLGMQLKNILEEIDLPAMINGLKDTVAGKPVMTDVEMREVMTAWEKDMQGKMKAKQEAQRAEFMEKQKKAGEENLKKGEDFLAENKKNEGVVTLPSGLQYKVIKEGTGEIPKDGDSVTTHYRGTLIDGTEFDSSYSRNEPATFGVNGVISGWTEALKLMKTGSKWQLFIPYKLAYGERGSPPKIGPNSTLVFDIELLSVTKSNRPPAPAPNAPKGN